MENSPKKEAFVPEDKQEEFAAAAQKGEYFEGRSEELSSRAEHEKQMAKTNAGIAVGFAGAAITAASTSFAENPVAGALIGTGAAAVFGLDAIRDIKGSRRHAKEATAAKAESEKSYGISRGIAEEGMKNTPPEEVIKIAREAMDADLQARKEDREKEERERLKDENEEV